MNINCIANDNFANYYLKGYYPCIVKRYKRIGLKVNREKSNSNLGWDIDTPYIERTASFFLSLKLEHLKENKIEKN